MRSKSISATPMNINSLIRRSAASPMDINKPEYNFSQMLRTLSKKKSNVNQPTPMNINSPKRRSTSPMDINKQQLKRKRSTTQTHFKTRNTNKPKVIKRVKRVLSVEFDEIQQLIRYHFPMYRVVKSSEVIAKVKAMLQATHKFSETVITQFFKALEANKGDYKNVALKRYLFEHFNQDNTFLSICHGGYPKTPVKKQCPENITVILLGVPGQPMLGTALGEFQNLVTKNAPKYALDPSYNPNGTPKFQHRSYILPNQEYLDVKMEYKDPNGLPMGIFKYPMHAQTVFKYKNSNIFNANLISNSRTTTLSALLDSLRPLATPNNPATIIVFACRRQEDVPNQTAIQQSNKNIKAQQGYVGAVKSMYSKPLRFFPGF